MKKLVEIFNDTKIPSLKVDTYFENYEELLSKYQNTQPIVVEVGVLLGGSLRMWKEYFGEGCRIIGVDMNPAAIKHREDGYEIFILNQESSTEWDQFFNNVGMIDILIDDGGHTNLGQIVTTIKASDYINDGGIIVVEDVHSSYAKDFGMPNKYSFDNWVNQLSAQMNKNYLGEIYSANHFQDNFIKKIYNIQRYRSIIAFSIKDKNNTPRSVSNFQTTEQILDYRYEHMSKTFKRLKKIANFSPINIISIGNKRPKLKIFNIFVNPITLKILDIIYSISTFLITKLVDLELKKQNNKAKIYFN